MVQVIKANGEIEEYNEGKVLASIIRAGIPQSMQDNVLQHVNSRLYNNIPTSEIYHHIIEFLGKSSYPFTRSSYTLKQAIMDLGPTGYPFEDYVAALLSAHGYVTKVRQMLMGNCVNHEIDVMAEKDDTHALVEVKFHNAVGTRSDVHVPLYTKSRFEDVKDKHNLTEVWLVTNTKATTDAVAYANCVGMKIISWSYPENGSLRDMIQNSQLHPITVLETLTAHHKTKLLNDHVVLCKTIHERPSVLDSLALSTRDKEQILSEVDFVCRKGETQ